MHVLGHEFAKMRIVQEGLETQAGLSSTYVNQLNALTCNAFPCKATISRAVSTNDSVHAFRFLFYMFEEREIEVNKYENLPFFRQSCNVTLVITISTFARASKKYLPDVTPGDRCFRPRRYIIPFVSNRQRKFLVTHNFRENCQLVTKIFNTVHIALRNKKEDERVEVAKRNGNCVTSLSLLSIFLFLLF